MSSRVILITGASRGIGSMIAELLGGNGMVEHLHVVVSQDYISICVK